MTNGSAAPAPHCGWCATASSNSVVSVDCCHVQVCDGSGVEDWYSTEDGSEVVPACCHGTATNGLQARMGVLRGHVVRARDPRPLRPGE